MTLRNTTDKQFLRGCALLHIYSLGFCATDLNGDGYHDLVVGAPLHGVGNHQVGVLSSWNIICHIFCFLHSFPSGIFWMKSGSKLYTSKTKLFQVGKAKYT